MSDSPKYYRPSTVAETLDVLGRRGADSNILAGGQSLIPFLKSNHRNPKTLIDIGRIDELRFIRKSGEILHIGATTLQHDIERSSIVHDHCPVLAKATSLIGPRAIRNRGTIGGSLVNADPRANLCAAALLLDAVFFISRTGQKRMVDAQKFFLGSYKTSLQADELLTEIRLPIISPNVGWEFLQLTYRPGDFALVSTGSIIEFRVNGIIDSIKVVIGGTSPFATRLYEFERLLKGKTISDELLNDATEIALKSIEFSNNPIASIEYRRHATSILLRRSITRAIKRSQDGELKRNGH